MDYGLSRFNLRNIFRSRSNTSRSLTCYSLLRGNRTTVKAETADVTADDVNDLLT